MEAMVDAAEALRQERLREQELAEQAAEEPGSLKVLATRWNLVVAKAK
jgi:hypothetical protein